MVNSHQDTPFLVSIMTGGFAGLVVDTALYPLDTLKTRLQSSQGFLKSGGFRGIYKGLNVAMTGSAPGSALFFVTYNAIKDHLASKYDIIPAPVQHMIAGSLSEIPACLVRVPTEIVKQRLQASITPEKETVSSVVRTILRSSGIGGMYSGFGIMIMREMPFSLIQFPLFEFSKSLVVDYRGSHATAVEAAIFGSMSGAIAAALTTPLDVIKTRIMLGSDAKGVLYHGVGDVFKRIVNDEGPRTLLSGIGPRVMWISIGGFIYFGAYDFSRKLAMKFYG